MSDQKTCPFCLEEIPARAIKCKHCESMIDDIPSKEVDSSKTSTAGSFSEEVKPDPTPQGVHYQTFSEKKKGKKFLVPLIVVAVLLLLLGAGAGYWFILGDTGDQVAEAVESDDILGSWKGTTADEEVYFEFMPNKMVKIGVPAEGYWFRTEYRIEQEENKSYLELHHRGTDEWERLAELNFTETGLLEMIDTWDGIVIDMQSHPGSEVDQVFRELSFER